MARIRSIKPDFWDSPDTARASLRCRLFYIAMWNWADDWGIGDANAGRLVSFAFPNDNDISAADYPTLRREVSECYGVDFYEVAGRQFYAIPTWETHQRTEKKARRSNPGPEDANTPGNTRESNRPTLSGGLSDTQPRIPARGKGEEGRGKKEEGSKDLSTSGEREREIELFDIAWKSWPKQTKRALALAKFKTAAKKIPVAELAEHVIRFGEAYAATTAEKFTPGLEAWLNQGRWIEALPVADQQDRKPTRTDQNLDFVQDLYRQQHEHDQPRGIEQ
jgi:hypothetical protein